MADMKFQKAVEKKKSLGEAAGESAVDASTPSTKEVAVEMKDGKLAVKK